MAAGDPVQLGVAYLYGIGEAVYTGHVIKTFNYAKDASESIHTDERGATDSILTKDPKQTLGLVIHLVGATTDFAPPTKNSVITMKGPDDASAVGWRVDSCSTAGSEDTAVLTLGLVREDSMAATYDA